MPATMLSVSPSGSTSLTHMDSDLSVSPSGLSLSSSLSNNSITTNLGQGFLAAASPRPAAPRVHTAAEPYMGPNPMTDWLPQLPASSLAAHLGQIRSDMQKWRADPVDCMEGLWGFDEFPPLPGMLQNMILLFMPVLLLLLQALVDTWVDCSLNIHRLCMAHDCAIIFHT